MIIKATNDSPSWPAIPYPAWAETCSALHLWTQIVGKYRLACSAWDNHSWHVTLYVTPTGLTTGPVFDGEVAVSLNFDFHNQILVGETGTARESFPLEAMSVAEFLRRTGELVEKLGGRFQIHLAPNEIADAVPFAQDTETRPYDAEAVVRFHRALLNVDRLFKRFSTGFLGKISPAHLFWGAFDFAVTRFSGREAPRHPGGIANLPDSVTEEAYSHEVSSAGFWPGGGGSDEAMFYSYAYPVPEGFSKKAVAPEAACFGEDLGEFLLPYEAVRTSDDPERALMTFLQTTYEAAAVAGNWDREALECEFGAPGMPRKVDY